jgi:hypothetical protein
VDGMQGQTDNEKHDFNYFIRLPRKILTQSKKSVLLSKQPLISHLNVILIIITGLMYLAAAEVSRKAV